MNIFNILNPDEEEFYDYFMTHKNEFLKEIINMETHRIDFTGMLPDNRLFVIGFSENDRYPHEKPEIIISFKVDHNHGHFLIYNINIEKRKLEEFEDENIFYLQKINQYEDVFI